MSLSWASLRSQIEESLPKGSLRARLVQGAFWSSVAALVSRGFKMLTTLVTARILGQVVFGELGMIRSTIGMFGIFAGLGLGITTTKYVAQFRDRHPERAGRVLTLSLLLACIFGAVFSAALFLSAPLVATKLIAAPHLTGTLRIAIGLLFLGALTGAQNGALVGFEAFQDIAKVGLVSGIISLPVVALGCLIGGLNGAVLGLVISFMIELFLNHTALRARCSEFGIPIVLKGCWAEARVLWRFSLPAFLSSISLSPITWGANAILVNSPGGYAELALYDAAYQVRTWVIFIARIAFQALLPILSSELNKEKPSTISKKLHIVNAYSTWFLATAVTVCLLHLVRPVLHLFGESFVAGERALVIVLCTIPIITYKDGIARLVQAKSLLWYSVASNLLWGTVVILGILAFAAHGAAGLAGAYLLAYFVNTVIVVPVYFKVLNMGSFIHMELQVGALLSIALVPSVLANVFHWPVIVRLGTLLVSLLVLLYAGTRIRKWFVGSGMVLRCIRT